MKIIFPSKKYNIQILWVCVIIFFCFLIYFSIKKLSVPSHGFASYYTASKMIIEGENIADFYDDDWFSTKVEEKVPGIYEVYLVNLPTTALVLVPIAALDYSTSRSIWIIFNLILLFVTVLVIIKQMKLSDIWLPLALLIILLFQPLYTNISFGQIYIFIFCLLAFAWFTYKSGNEKLSGILIGLVFIIKTAALFIPVLFLIKKKWIALLWFLLTVLCLFIITLPVLGLDSWSTYINKMISYSSSPTLSVTAYQSVHSFFHHFFVFDEKWNPYPPAHLPTLAKVLTILFSFIVLSVTVIKSYKINKPEQTFGIFLIISVILNPASIDYHYMIMLIPILILFGWLTESSSKLSWSVFIISFILIAASIPYISPKITKGLLAVFAYPKLYGALGLLFLYLRVAQENRTIGRKV